MIKWIGQHIVDLIARFRSDVYLEDIADGTVANDKFLGLDSNNKIVKETVSTGTVDLASGVTGTLPVGNGGTGLTSISTLLNSNVTTISGNAATATNLVASTSTAVQLGTIELGHASDTTISRVAAGYAQVEGETIVTTITPNISSAQVAHPIATLMARRTLTTA